LDAPGALHHVIVRGIERKEIFWEEFDYQDLLSRFETIVDRCEVQIYGWVLMPNHFHLVIRTGKISLSSAMRKLLTGYAVNFNRRHNRHGHLFQNRYKSILVEDEPYFLELVAYIHLNPYRARQVKTLNELDRYPLSGHSAIMGKVTRPWQNVEGVLEHFGSDWETARMKYRAYVEERLDQGRRPELTGGGLVRSAGGWANVLSRRRRKERMISDTRILGSGEFVERVLEETERRTLETLRLSQRGVKLDNVCKAVAKAYDIDIAALTSGSRRRSITKARSDAALLAVKKLGMNGALVARYLGVSEPCISYIMSNKTLSPLGEEVWRKLESSI
jgi:REP element-mobilizing transposase RayT